MIEKKRQHKHEGMFAAYEDADIVIWGIPFDGTCSNRPGTRFGPRGIRSELIGLETYSPYLDDSLEAYNYCDIGDIDLPFGNTNLVIDHVYQASKSLLEDNKRLLTMGGEHLISYPVIKAYIEKYSNLNVIHLDAHTDLRYDYMGEKLSHATVMQLVYQMLGQGNLYQYGIRSGTKEEFDFAKAHTVLSFNSLEGMESLVTKLGDEPVYLSIDLDVLDPSIFPGTGTPEPGGVSFNQLLDGIIKMVGLNVVGADIVELSPQYDPSGVSNIVGAKVLREVALLMAK